MHYPPDDTTPLYVISVAAQLAGMHAQTLRQYDRLGLVVPSRASGGGRRYSARDVAQLHRVQQLSQEGISLVGIARILHLHDRIADLEDRLADTLDELARIRNEQTPGRGRVFAAGPRSGDVVAVPPGRRPTRSGTRAVVLWQPPRPPVGRPPR